MGNLCDDYREARRRTHVPEPIEPIRDNFARADPMYADSQAWATIAEFFRQWRAVRRERRARRRT